MTYYKLIKGDTFVGVATQNDFRIFQRKHSILLGCTEEKGQYVQCGEKLYHDKWMHPVSTNDIPFEEASVIAISMEEYDTLYEALQKDEEITLPELEPEPESSQKSESVEVPVAEDAVTSDYVRSVKLKELSAACASAIRSGFDLTISGEVLHFSMSANDQLNLNAASVQILNGESKIPYHPDGGDFRIFSSDEMVQIINAANAHKTYHLAYFNSLKKWVNALSRISSIQAVTYGSEIPKKYVSSFLKSLEEDA